jgi:hypothetical protein
MTNFKEMTTMKSINKDWQSVLGTLKICHEDKINVMLHADNFKQLKRELEDRGIEYITLDVFVLDQELINQVVFEDHYLGKPMICSANIFSVMRAEFKDRFFHLEVSHLQK